MFRILDSTMKLASLFCRGLAAGLAVLTLLVFTNVMPVQAANITISSRTPAVNALNVAVASNITVTFSSSINSGTVTANTFNVDGSISGKIAGAYTISGSTVTFNPTNNFKPGESITVTLTTGIADASAAVLGKAVTWQFRAAAGGSGTFSNTAHPIGSTYHTFGCTIASGFFNTDNYLDIVIGNYPNAPDIGQNYIFMNAGNGTFENSGVALGSGGDDSWGLAAGDMDGDGDQDIVVANAGHPSMVYNNNGSGSFTSSNVFDASTTAYHYGAATGDMNGDGWLDIVVPSYGGTQYVFLNDGDGTFDSARRSFGKTTSEYGVALGDVDGDGDLDAAISCWNNPSYICKNDGTANWMPAPFSAAVTPAAAQPLATWIAMATWIWQSPIPDQPARFILITAAAVSRPAIVTEMPLL
jgi:hypothetical protein